MEKFASFYQISFTKAELQNMINEAFNHPAQIEKLNQLGLTDELIRKNIVKLYDFIINDAYCSDCPGADKCEKENAHLSLKISYRNDSIFKEMVPCKKAIQSMILQKTFLVHDFPYEWFDSTPKMMDKTGARLQGYEKFVNYLKQQEFSWIYLYGNKNVGRSYFAATMAIEYARKNKEPVAFIDSETRFSEMNAYFYKQKNDYYETLNRYQAVKLLVIDDFGNELKSDVIRDEIVLKILEYRFKHQLMTIFVSKYHICDIVDMYNKSQFAKPKALKIGELLSKACVKEINLGSLPIYQ